MEKNIIKIIGVGGAGGNAVNYMFREGINDVTFALCNTDSQALNESPIPMKIQMGQDGFDINIKKYRQYAEKCEPELRSMLSDGTKMSIIIAGMGGRIGTGAAPVIARISKELDILTLGIVTIPFKFEGHKKIVQALDGIKEMAKHVDSLIVINNDHIRNLYFDATVLNSFNKANETLYMAAKSVAEIITTHGLINLDINDMKSVLTGGGLSFIGVGYGEGEHAVKDAIEEMINYPLLNDIDVYKSKKHILNIHFSNKDVYNGFTAEDIHYIDEFQQNFGYDFEIMWGLAIDPKLDKRIKATIIVTGFDIKDMDKMIAFYHQSK